MGWVNQEHKDRRAYTSFNSGLSFESKLKFTKADEKPYAQCYGMFGAKNDCLAEKGFQEIEMHGVKIFNTHLDAGGTGADASVREVQLNEMSKALPKEGRVLVMGDFNLKRDRVEDETLYRNFIAQAGLSEIARSDDGIDVILGRGISATKIGTIGNDLLSDHKGLVAELQLQ